MQRAVTARPAVVDTADLPVAEHLPAEEATADRLVAADTVDLPAADLLAAAGTADLPAAHLPVAADTADLLRVAADSAALRLAVMANLPVAEWAAGWAEATAADSDRPAADFLLPAARWDPALDKTSTRRFRSSSASSRCCAVGEAVV